VDPVELQGLVVRRARREYRVPVRFTGLDERGGFEETALGYTPEEALAEAGRCLDCHQICSLCVGVCPNMALMTYESAPFAAMLPDLLATGGKIVAGAPTRFAAEQRLQIAVLTDFCNECGNCVTACPTSGAPYRDKPRLYLDREDFEAQAANAFMLLDGGVMEGRFDGQTHRIRADGRFVYEAPAFQAVLDPATLGVIEATPIGVSEGQVFSLEPAAMMATLLAGLRQSMPHIPAASGDGTFVPAPVLPAG
jgi:putative selenate reductase